MNERHGDTVSFGYEEVAPDEKTKRVGAVFSNVAAKYDVMNDAMSGGMHRLWKNTFVRRVKPQPGEAILDMAGGTGDIAFRLAERGAEVTVADINQDMLDVGIERALKRGIDKDDGGLVWSRSIRVGKSSVTRPSMHIWRLLKWGRTLAKHGALRGIERDPNTPQPVKRLTRIARFGTVQPRAPDYAAAFQAIGPAAIKLGQSLATRPDLVGEEAARNLLTLQDDLPPVPFEAIRAEIARSFEAPVEALFAEFAPVPVGSASMAA